MVNIFRRFFLNKNETEFINKYSLDNKNNSKKFIAVQCTINNYYYILLLKLILSQKKFENLNVIGIWSYDMKVNVWSNPILKRIYDIKNEIFFYFERKKWSKLYKSVGVKKFYNLGRPFYFYNKKKIFYKKKNLLKYKLNGILVGDLIYDSLIRFRDKPTINLDDKIINEYLISIKNNLSSLEALDKKYRFQTYISHYASYVQSGLPTRFFVNKKIDTFSSGSNHHNLKKITQNDLLHNVNFKKLKKVFDVLSNKNKKRLIAKLDLNKKFLGRKSLSSNYLKENSFTFSKKNNLNDIDGVLFLHDFLDAPHDRGGWLIFNDFYEWANHTLHFILKNKLNIAVKLHPNSIHNSEKIENYFQNKFKKLKWLSKKVNNIDIYKNVKFVVSANGSVLYEAAYFNKICISAGLNPNSSFKIFKDPKNISEYEKFLKNPKKAIINNKNIKNKILELYYAYYFAQKDFAPKICNDINLLSMDAFSSNDLIKYSQLIKKYEKNNKNY